MPSKKASTIVIPKSVERNIFNGYVLAQQGGWVPLQTQLDSEKKVIDYVSNGYIFQKGSWYKMEMSAVSKDATVARSLDTDEETFRSTTEFKAHFFAFAASSLLAILLWFIISLLL